MDQIVFLIPIAVLLGLIGLGAFLWSMKSGQFDDLEGAAYRVLFEEDDTDGQPKNQSVALTTPHEKSEVLRPSKSEHP